MAEKLSELIKEFVDHHLDIKRKEAGLQYFKKGEHAQRQAVIDAIKVQQADIGKKIDKIKVPETL